ncbi:hypothetical protein OPT61_g8304 [Boeremia exigua]|uniref:Uncharacterized protein n=1 Tax=Boeremia exigua TaxID=749465 RepID=A0ACC2HYQ8_9PLEO|nr:hypothetical protein OPT61_g8304 [Boeremia exigua]
MPSLSTLFGFGAATLFSVASATKYAPVDTFPGSSFFDHFDFVTEEKTNGFVKYVDRARAEDKKYIRYEGGDAIFGVDYESKLNSANGGDIGRESVRLEGRKDYNKGLFVLDVKHMPGGSCGTWPAFWSLGRAEWPTGGEIDILEGVNKNTANTFVLHTDTKCKVNGLGQTGIQSQTDCAYDTNGSLGCGVTDTRTRSYGTDFNANNGGYYVTEWQAEGIKIWFFPRGSEPKSLTSSEPDTSEFGLPAASFQGDCDIEKRFMDQRFIFTNTFCGDWAGNVYAQSGCPMYQGLDGMASCKKYVAEHPEVFKEAYWRVGSFKTFNKRSLTSSSSVAPSSTRQASSSSTRVSSSSTRASSSTVQTSSSSSRASSSTQTLSSSTRVSSSSTAASSSSVHVSSTSTQASSTSTRVSSSSAPVFSSSVHVSSSSVQISSSSVIRSSSAVSSSSAHVSSSSAHTSSSVAHSSSVASSTAASSSAVSSSVAHSSASTSVAPSSSVYPSSTAVNSSSSSYDVSSSVTDEYSSTVSASTSSGISLSASSGHVSSSVPTLSASETSYPHDSSSTVSSVSVTETSYSQESSSVYPSTSASDISSVYPSSSSTVDVSGIYPTNTPSASSSGIYPSETQGSSVGYSSGTSSSAYPDVTSSYAVDSTTSCSTLSSSTSVPVYSVYPEDNGDSYETVSSKTPDVSSTTSEYPVTSSKTADYDSYPTASTKTPDYVASSSSSAYGSGYPASTPVYHAFIRRRPEAH